MSLQPNSDDPLSTKNNTVAQGGYDAYLGTYSGDDATGVVTQHLVGCLSPANIGVARSRAMSVRGRRLVIEHRKKLRLAVLALLASASVVGQPRQVSQAGSPAPVEAQRAAASVVTPSQNRSVLFAASWCGYCRQARAYLARSKIQYEEVDVDTPSGKAAFAQYGKGAIPLLVSKGETLRGFSELAYDYFFARQQ